MAVSQSVIIEVALNGATPRSRNPAAITPAEIARRGIDRLDAGAALVHKHTRDPVLGGSGVHDPAEYEEAWRAILDERSYAILYPTMAPSIQAARAATLIKHLQFRLGFPR